VIVIDGNGKIYHVRDTIDGIDWAFVLDWGLFWSRLALVGIALSLVMFAYLFGVMR